MREPPPGVADAAVLAAVVEYWAGPHGLGVDAVEHLPVGFGAHHWCASAGGRRQLFVTLDRFGAHHDLASLRSAYGTAGTLAGRLEFVHGGLFPWAEPFGPGALSVTPWLVAARPAELDLAATAALLERLHATASPSGLPRWGPRVGADLADDLAERVRRSWNSGPYGERARTAINARLTDLVRRVRDYHRLVAAARRRRWVVTHGEPGLPNQLVRDADPTRGLVLVDWESVQLAPPERDLRELPTAGDPAMREMFDLEWRLDEISQYADWFAGPHTGTASDDVALGGLLDELSRAG